MEPQAAKLCARCQLFEFDEREAGASVAISEDGNEYLSMPTKWHEFNG